MLWFVLWGDFGARIEFLLYDADLEGALQKPTWCDPAASGQVCGTRVGLDQVITRQCPCSGDVGSSLPIVPFYRSVLVLPQSLPVVPLRGLGITTRFWNVCKMTFYFRNFRFFKIWICDFSEHCNYQVTESKATTDVFCISVSLIKKCLRELMILSDYSYGCEREGFVSAFLVKAAMTPKE